MFEVVYGGARGGGKTDAALGDFAAARRATTAPPPRACWCAARAWRWSRRSRGRGRSIGPQGAEWARGRSRFDWPNGAVLYFRYLDNDADADRYQGHDYTRVYVEELTQFPSPLPVDKLKATLRSAAGVAVRLSRHLQSRRRRATTGSRRATSIRARGRIVARPSQPVRRRRSSLARLFIPARLADNPALLANDPLYIARLQQSGSAELVRAWLEGDWNIIEGAFFDKWSERNIVAPFADPGDWTRFRAFDWGYAAPFSVGWWAVARTTCAGATGRRSCRAARWCATASGTAPARGRARACGWRPRRWRAGILEREAGETIAYRRRRPLDLRQRRRPLDRPSACAAAACASARPTTPGSARPGRSRGWDQMRARIAGDEDGADAGRCSTPAATSSAPCRCCSTTRCGPRTSTPTAEDHIADETRYACLARPLAAERPRAARKRARSAS